MNRVRVEPLVRALLDGVRGDLGAAERTAVDRTGGDAERGESGRGESGRGEVERSRVDLGVVPVFSDERPLLGLAGLIDWRGSGCLSAVVRSGFCSSAPREQVLLPCDRRLPVDRLVLVGLGPREQYDEARARALAEQFVSIAVGLAAPTVLIALPTHGRDRTLTEVAFASLLATLEQRASQLGQQTAGGEHDEAGDPEPSEPAPASQSWWVAADEAVVARLRRVLSGPPRATRGGAGLHT